MHDHTPWLLFLFLALLCACGGRNLRTTSASEPDRSVAEPEPAQGRPRSAGHEEIAELLASDVGAETALPSSSPPAPGSVQVTDSKLDHKP